MDKPGSVTQWLSQLATENPSEAQEQLWNRYFEALTRLARQRLRAAPRRAKDEEDVALSALDSLFEDARRGRYPQLRDRENLWPLLVTITARKAHNVVRDERAQKRGGGRIRGVSAFGDEQGGEQHEPADREPTPEFVAEFTEQWDRLMQLLNDDRLREIAQAKLEGYTTLEIARRCRMSPRSVERRLAAIRDCWSAELS